MTDIRLKGPLLCESSELTLEKAANLCRAAEASAKQLKELRKENADQHEPEVHVVKSSSRGDCTKCGTRHAVRSCTAFRNSCHKCKKKNHFAQMCQMPRNSSVNELVEDTSENRSTDPVLELNSLFMGTTTSPKTTSARFVIASINETQVFFKLDTGAEANVMPSSVLSKLKISKPLEKTNVLLTSYGNFKVQPEGKVDLHLK